ncbi:MerR family transcriptional regulator [Pontibacillus yanchengensis]|uniref:MerR family transcriptional regulator n=2 Tax=Pontibacillus yanchengensis TaxID=462910 RepID=A0ACC7VKF9_9BACI|nr:MerR family transcriptional regulator [Pontibacillus yanchengensis]MYL32716.1 MerR family transcriptional regulator [Pontibacillus yanchengensis]MYL55110.1 MerR family transcriptional regulator [Pontibacillus yanchengensis]
MSSIQGKYNIKAVSQMLGVQPGTLRAWERRYQMIRPPRNEAGHRLYTEEHVKVLKWLLEKVNNGFTISQAVSILEDQQETVEKSPSIIEESSKGHLEQITEELLQSLLSFDESRAHEKLDYAFSMFSPEKVALDIVGTLLVRIGTQWEENRISSAHEHFATNFLRSRLGMMLISMPSDKLLPKAVCVCGPNEKHELGLLIFTLYLKRRGYDVIYLGQSVAAGDVDVVINEVQPRYLFMSNTMKENIPVSVRLAESLKEHYPGLFIGLGGFAFDQLPEKEKEPLKPYLIGKTKEEWEQWLALNK